jgi:hypothetical protein
MKRIGLFGASAMFLLFTVTAMAQPGNRAGMSSSQFQMGSWGDPRGYYFEVRYTGGVAPQVLTRLYDGMLIIGIRQASNTTPGMTFQSQMSQRYPIPRDADLSRMSRQDLPGRILIMIPRRQMGNPSRW